MKIQYNIEVGFFTPADEIVNMPQCFLPPDARFFFDHDLIEPEPDVIHAQRCNVIHIPLCDIRGKMFHIAFRDMETQMFG